MLSSTPSSPWAVHANAIPMLSRNRSAALSAPPFRGHGARSRYATSTCSRYNRRDIQDEAMIGRLNHVAIAVRDIAKASEIYRKTLGAEVSAAVPQPEHGVTTVFITLP